MTQTEARGVKWWGVRVVGVVLMLVLAFGAFNYSRIKRLLAVNTLFDEDHIVHNFTHMRELFHTSSIRPASQPKTHEWIVEASPLPEAFEFEGKTRPLQAFLDETNTTALVVVHRGKIVHESYPHPEDGGAEALRVSWSMAKSVLSALIGIALTEKKINSLNDSVSEYVPSLVGTAYEGVSLRHVLNMSSGVLFNEDYLDYDSDINKMGRVIAIGGSMDEFASSLTERERKAGEQRHYVSIDTHVIGMVLRAATGKSVGEYLNEKLWSKMGVDQEIYYVTDEEGVEFVLGGLNMRTRDYARFGQLFLQEGRWLGEQIVPSTWVRVSTANNAPPSTSDGMGYGYQWWVPKRAREEFFAIGIYGQYIYVNREASIVVVKNSAHRGFRDDGASGAIIEDTSIEAFRAIAAHYASAAKKADEAEKAREAPQEDPTAPPEDALPAVNSPADNSPSDEASP